VWPSGGDFTTSCVPVTPLAPGRFSITTGWPSCTLNCCPMMRATVSGAPAENGTTMRMARFG